ncbi:hypothetical protein TCAL_01676 [Tigriopus californicus]|uniref:Peptidase S1 domain-containing protein n=1 Tax=Tigriopus californicus TaxID=6832 RepID=A0A553PL68_TIGCA|nr:protein masquerade-like [Tigriopus californicus]TRY78418.1 hypothetical protein TCAL_01676 [Tigriopus californicus]|eukprot:TCALIF_01676-PA protein Name:"Similar to Sb Serine proteinase stubble (Drosophila melanogaster)" AED:0.26 eAED:0.27 QI:0/-1/0/1/-1/1/1/0/640
MNPFEVVFLSLLAACLGFVTGELRKGPYHYVYTPPIESLTLPEPTIPISPYSDQWVSPSEAKRRLRLTLFLTQLGNTASPTETINQIPSSSPLSIAGSRAVVLTPTLTPDSVQYRHRQPHNSERRKKKRRQKHPSKFRRNRNHKGPFRRRYHKGGAGGSPQSRDGTCLGHCTNMFACMLQGGRPETKRSSNCPGIFHVCCSRWTSSSSTSGPAQSPPLPPSPPSPSVPFSAERPYSQEPLYSSASLREAPSLAIGGQRGSHRAPKHLRFQQSLRPQKSGRALAIIDEPEQNLISYSSASIATASTTIPLTIVPADHHHQHGVPIPLTSVEETFLESENIVPDYDFRDVYYDAAIPPEDGYLHCGVSRNANRRIMGGLDAGYGQFPWTAHIKIRGPNIDKECGGTLINERWVLTAGHCTQYCINVPLCGIEIPQHEITYKVILGEYDQLENEPVLPDAYMAIDVIRHPLYRNVMRLRDNGYVESEPRYDLALLMLDREVKLAPNVAPICLPTPEFHVLAPGTPSTVVGWGRVGKDSKAPHSNVLQAATIPILSDNQCLSETGLSNFDDQICAGNSNSDVSACPGDSGGALQVQDDEGRWMIVGVVSNGPSVCGLQPVIFHKIAKTLSWITNVMERQQLNVP